MVSILLRDPDEFLIQTLDQLRPAHLDLKELSLMSRSDSGTN